MAKAKFFARVWVWDTGDPSQIEVWSNDLDPMEPMKIPIAEWVHNHLAECYSDKSSSAATSTERRSVGRFKNGTNGWKILPFWLKRKFPRAT
jgi:hypothetical protein